MALTDGGLCEVVVNQLVQGQVNLNVWQYELVFYPPTITPVQFLEAYWNNVKVAYRGIYPTNMGSVFQSLRVRELNNIAGDYAEYDIPAAERTGTRTPGAGAELMPPFTGIGVRLVVGTRLTRPGQKRFSCLVENDNISGVAQGVVTAPVTTLMNLMTAALVLGAPAALADLIPIVTRKDATGFVTAHQPITGHIINPYITSQNTRKFGRGS